MKIIDNTVDFETNPIRGNELLLGCGNNKEKQVALKGSDKWTDLVTLDIDPDCEPDVVWDLAHIPLPFEDETFQEIHAYEVLEHLGQQGDWRRFFAEFTEYHRILKPGGVFIASVPCWDSIWAWGDPGHTRVISEGTVHFLDQDSYKDIGANPMTDYRHVYKADFKIEYAGEKDERFVFVLRKK